MDNPTTNNPTNGVRPCSSLLALARWAGKIGWQVRLAAATARGEPGTLRVPKAPA